MPYAAPDPKACLSITTKCEHTASGSTIKSFSAHALSTSTRHNRMANIGWDVDIAGSGDEENIDNVHAYIDDPGSSDSEDEKHAVPEPEEKAEAEPVPDVTTLTYGIPVVYRQTCEFLSLCGYDMPILFDNLPPHVIETQMTIVFWYDSKIVLTLLGSALFDAVVYDVVLTVTHPDMLRPFRYIIGISRKLDTVKDKAVINAMKGDSILSKWLRDEEVTPLTYAEFNLKLKRTFAVFARLDSFVIYLKREDMLIERPDVNVFNGSLFLPPLASEMQEADTVNEVESMYASTHTFTLISDPMLTIVFPSEHDSAFVAFDDTVTFILNRGVVLFTAQFNGTQMHVDDFSRLYIEKPIAVESYEDYEANWNSLQAYLASCGAYLPDLDMRMRSRFFDLSETIILRLQTPTRPIVVVIVSEQIANSNIFYNSTGSFDDNRVLTCCGSLANGTSEGVTLIVMRTGVADPQSAIHENRNVVLTRIENIAVLAHQESAVPQSIPKPKADVLSQLHLGGLVSRFKKPKEAPLLELMKRDGLLYHMATRRSQLTSH